ncbi:hypothetical protein G647_06959 [Cladophialophora carrionii CBS 160.54]|uniref:Uncharacterized protein n=1 Tax=Cladophialophora carrionii CBS 160.54 TaxID=1279043 RepID=V9D3M8_9EURO|nr:uncharacterized protein G647_06959 [Cladophialophora carrionii CBS 160.54]ETI20617.1 hypothetical protein G647_06959 [Cladophialophora carrionii CBS 160.54]
MRMTPAIGLSIPQSVPKGGPRREGKYYPGGIAGSVNGWVVHRDKLFEDHVLVFRPEPRLSGDVMEMKNFIGIGHLCIGQNVVLSEINKITH